MTGIEAISDGVPSFKPPEWRNARTTLTWMVALLATMFAGITVLAYAHGLVPEANNTILSQLTESEWGRGVLYGIVQASTALILVLAANTAFNDFPRLLFFLARDRYAPRLFTRLGDRLAYSNGVIVLAVAAAVLLVAFNGQTDRLIALYAIGVFLSFTLSQTGMVRRWWRLRGPGWRHSLAVNLLGAVLSAGVLIVVAADQVHRRGLGGPRADPPGRAAVLAHPPPLRAGRAGHRAGAPGTGARPPLGRAPAVPRHLRRRDPLRAGRDPRRADPPHRRAHRLDGPRLAARPGLRGGHGAPDAGAARRPRRARGRSACGSSGRPGATTCPCRW